MELKALEASTNRAASQLAVENISRMAWIAASDPAACPAQVCKGPTADITSSSTQIRAIIQQEHPQFQSGGHLGACNCPVESVNKH